jgi:serine/threonine protein kinase
MPDAVIHPTPQELTAFGLGKLPERAAAVVAAHLESCPACRQAVAGVSADSFLNKVRDAKQDKTLLPPSSGKPTNTPSRAGQPAIPVVPCPDVPPELANHPKYHISRELGRGGMGVVYQGWHKEMNRQIVIKVINRALLDKPESIDRFRREIQAAAQLSHPNIVTAHDAERAGELHMLVMEFVPGQNLAEVLEKKGPLSVAHACHYMRQAAYGLQHAHERGMVHRDIKPQNLIRTPNGRIKILDFGLAKMVRERETGKGLTPSDACMGTAEFMAPEQAQNAAKADIRADLYSLGCTLYCLLAGRPPFREDTWMNTVLAHIQKQPQPLTELRPDVPERLWRVVARLMAKEPAQRYQKPSEVVAALAPFIKPGSKPDAKSAAPPPPAVKSPVMGTKISADTNQIKNILREVPGKVPLKREPAKEEAASPLADVAVNASLTLTKGLRRKGRKGCVVTAVVSASLALMLILIAGTILNVNVQSDNGDIGEAMAPKAGTDKSLPRMQKVEGDALIDPEPHLFIRFHDYREDKFLPEPTMRFGLLAKDRDNPDRTKKLTFDEHGLSNNTVIRLDGQEYIFGQTPSQWVEMQNKLQGEIAGRPRDGLASSWLLPGRKLKITQEVEIVPGIQTRRLDTCLVRYILKNQDTLPHQVGIRFMLDTFIGGTDGVPFFIPGYWDLCDTEISFNSPDRVPDFIQALENKDLRNPGTVAYLQFRTGTKIESPSQVQIGGWPNPELQKSGIPAAKSQFTGWNVPRISMKERVGNNHIDDSAVTMYWNEQTLEPGKSRVVGFTYGLGNADTRESSGHLLFTAGGRLVPNVDFSLMALVHNPKPDETLTLELPEGIETMGQQLTQRVPGIPPGASASICPVTWRLRASNEGKYELTVRSSTGVKQKLSLTIRTHGMFDSLLSSPKG